MEALFILLLALVIDLALGEPPLVIHPVAGMGRVASFLIKAGRPRSPAAQFLYGLGVVLITVGIFVVPVYYLLSYLRGVNLVVYIIIASVILKTSLSLRELRRAAIRVRNLLVDDKLAEARFELRALVGRDTTNLDKSLMVSATVESVAENSCDSFFAPLFYFLFLGLPGAIGYRVINTLDAMIGHHGEFEYLGKFAARLDSAANFIPARITALTIVLASWVCRAKATSAWRIMLRDRRKTDSPNAGWTMSAAAGALEVQLEKVGYYKLGDNLYPLSTSSIDASLRIATTAALIWGLLVMLTMVIYHAAT
ncbi:MAG: cobalamin biosynthesis protein [Chloroflexi bacterium]|nr:cobalamin biosynthesis protein [Chloroflexota bacterium]